MVLAAFFRLQPSQQGGQLLLRFQALEAERFMRAAEVLQMLREARRHRFDERGLSVADGLSQVGEIPIQPADGRG